ncbi:MAG: hypothetical protein JO272_02690 [Pseudonocardiales bacterium]|nr:hypothetical protein [Pseudonocardiales bacterium]
MAAEAAAWGRGGISAVHRATGASRTTIRRGMAELADTESTQSAHRVRAPGAGRKKAKVAELGGAVIEVNAEPGFRMHLARWRR